MKHYWKMKKEKQLIKKLAVQKCFFNSVTIRQLKELDKRCIERDKILAENIFNLASYHRK